MMNRSTTGGRTAKRVLVSLAASACLIVGSPVVGVSSAATGGAHKPVSATHGDCKNDNRGKHNGYDCPTASDNGTDGTTDSGPIVTTPPPVIYVS
jgi:hypothetical protein